MNTNHNITLPTPRALITSLINTLTTTPIPPKIETQPAVNEPYSATGIGTVNGQLNPLKALPPSHRALLTTLHVLFPTGMLLQSLDLLDRGLVTRIIHKDTSLSVTNQQSLEQEEIPVVPAVVPPQAHIHLPPEPGAEIQDQEIGKGSNAVYIVRSSQTPKSRFSNAMSGAGSGTGGQSYHVHLSVWNCSCAAFAFSSFPSTLSSSSPWLELPSLPNFSAQGGNGGEDWDEKEWEFGGLSCDGKEGGAVPVCKHLLACVLAERWRDVLGSHVKEQSVGREEMAGLGAE